MVDNDSYFLAKVSLVGAATAAIVDSKHVIPPEVRHYLNLLRSLCRDVRLLWDLREKRMNYLTATLHDLREVDGVLATMTLDAAKFEPLLAKYQPSEAVSSITPGQGGPLEPERTAWTSDDVKHLCKMAENLSFQTETIQVIIMRLGGGIMQSSLDTRRYTPPPEPATGYGKIENVELFKGLFAPAPPSESGRSVSRKSLPAGEPKASD